MGFWDTVGNLAKGTANAVVETLKEIKELTEEYYDEDDDYLIKKLKRGTMQQRVAAGKVLKERGYDLKELNKDS